MFHDSKGETNWKSNRQFVHLRSYTQYSLSKGAIKIKDLVKCCLKNKIPAVGVSDLIIYLEVWVFSRMYNEWYSTNNWL